MKRTCIDIGTGTLRLPSIVIATLPTGKIPLTPKNETSGIVIQCAVTITIKLAINVLNIAISIVSIIYFGTPPSSPPPPPHHPLCRLSPVCAHVAVVFYSETPYFPQHVKRHRCCRQQLLAAHYPSHFIKSTICSLALSPPPHHSASRAWDRDTRPAFTPWLLLFLLVRSSRTLKIMYTQNGITHNHSHIIANEHIEIRRNNNNNNAPVAGYYTTSVISWRSHYFLLCHFYHIKTVITLNRNCSNYCMRTKMERLEKKIQKRAKPSDENRARAQCQPKNVAKQFLINLWRKENRGWTVWAAHFVSFYLLRGIFVFFFFSRVWNHWTMKIMSLVWLNNIAWNGYQYPVASGKTSHRISDDAICTDHLFVMWSPANKFWFDKQITAKMRRRKKWNTRTDERDPARRAPSSLSRL